MVLSETAPGVRRRLTLDPPGLFAFEVCRLLDHEVGQLLPHLRPVAPSHTLDAWLFPGCSLVDTLVGGERVFGRSSSSFDCWKGSFSFPLLLTATRKTRTIRYLLRLRDHRGTVGVSFRRFQWEVVKTSEARCYMEPVDDELSRAEIDRLGRALIEFIALSGEAFMRQKKPFFHTVDSEFIVYGCSAEGPFEQRFESTEEFEERVQALSREVGDIAREHDLENVRSLLADISHVQLRSP
ncbi:MAG: hypothetical protein GXP55_23720 [Deltaproteobacteria bacterium]|nr:hypothetical protein [Deltaproteobacteria bacterium]